VGSSQTAATRARPQRNRPAKNRLERPRTSRGSFCILWIEDYYHRCIMRVDMSFLEVGTRNKNYTFFFDSKLEKLSLPCIYHRLAVSSYSSYSKRWMRGKSSVLRGKPLFDLVGAISKQRQCDSDTLCGTRKKGRAPYSFTMRSALNIKGSLSMKKWLVCPGDCKSNTSISTGLDDWLL
jgi:hypothetical protein